MVDVSSKEARFVDPCSTGLINLEFFRQSSALLRVLLVLWIILNETNCRCRSSGLLEASPISPRRPSKGILAEVW